MAQSWRPWEAAGTQPLSLGDVNKAINLPPALPPTSNARPTNVTLPSISSLLSEPLRDENTASYPYEKHRASIHTAPQPPRPLLPTNIPVSGPVPILSLPRQPIPPPLIHQAHPHPPAHAHAPPHAPLHAHAHTNTHVHAHAPPPARTIPPQQTIPTIAPKSTAKKRKSDVLEDPQSGERDGGSAADPIDCDVLRDKIRRLIRAPRGGIPLQIFLELTKCSMSEYTYFSHLAGPQAGADTDMCRKVSQFFREREQPEQRGPRAGTKRPTRLVAALDVGGITLDGEDNQSVKVFDTCDRVRRRINKFLTDHDDVTASAFCREIAKALPNDRKVQSKQLNDFLAKKGPTAGNTSCVYYTAYVFFEKRRLKDGRPKDQTRLKMEEIYEDGMNTTELLTHVTVFQGEEPIIDEYGRIHYVQSNDLRRQPRR